MQFLMGLNDSYIPTRTQILLMDPVPSITKVFALVVQEECQCTINNGFSPLLYSILFGDPNSLATASTYFTLRSKCERPICSHCGV